MFEITVSEFTRRCTMGHQMLIQAKVLSASFRSSIALMAKGLRPIACTSRNKTGQQRVVKKLSKLFPCAAHIASRGACPTRPLSNLMVWTTIAVRRRSCLKSALNSCSSLQRWRACKSISNFLRRLTRPTKRPKRCGNCSNSKTNNSRYLCS